MRRLFVDFPIADKREFVINGDDAKHLLYAMRVRPSQVFVIVDREGTVFEAKVVACTKDEVTMQFVSFMENADTEPPIDVVLAQSLPKSDKMDYIVQKAVELGASEIVPVLAKHCVVKYDDKKCKARQKKWQKIADEAAKQCGRTNLPQVEDFVNLQALVEKYADYTCIVCYEAEAKQSLKEVLRAEDMHSKKFLVLIGPEGGFTPEEIAFCKEHNFISISLGKRILRTETASLSAISIIMYEKGDL